MFGLLVRPTHVARLNTYIISCFDCYYVIIKLRTSRIGFCEGVYDDEVNRATQRCVLNESFQFKTKMEPLLVALFLSV